MFTVVVSNVQPQMLAYGPADVTSHRIVFISVFRWCRCCASCDYIFDNMFYVFLNLIAHSAFTIHCCFMMFLQWQCMVSSWSWAAMNRLSVYPFRPKLHNQAWDFLYLLMVFLGPSRIAEQWLSLEFFYLVIFNGRLKLIQDNWVAVSSYTYFYLINLFL